jgi:hypothetical protein
MFRIGRTMVLVAALAAVACDTRRSEPQPGARAPQHVKAADIVVRVTDEEARAIVASVWVGGYLLGTTDTTGAFRIELSESRKGLESHVVRASSTGYRPTTRTAKAGESLTLTLRRGADGTWTPPSCAGVRPQRPSGQFIKSNVMVADDVLVRVPPNSEIERYGFHYGVGERICREDDCLSVRVGSEGVFADFIDGLQEIGERDVRRGVEVVGADYRGIDRDGTFVRKLSLGLHEVDYRAASRSLAGYFDKIVDSMCWIERE